MLELTRNYLLPELPATAAMLGVNDSFDLPYSLTA